MRPRIIPGPEAPTPATGLSYRVQAIRQLPLATKLHWILRIGMLMEFVGHGAFGIMGKEGWLAYFNVFRIPDSAAWDLMPVVGAVDITIGVVTLLRPMRAVLAYAAFWGVMTALLRPMAGQGVWEEVLERGGNFGIPLALLVLVGVGSPRHVRSWFESARPREMSPELARRLSWVLRAMVAALLVGHGAFGLSNLHDQEWTTYFGVLGIGPEAIIGWNLIPVVGWFEVALGVAVLLKPWRGLVAFVLVWKVATELLRPLAGEPFFEFVERGGDYVLPLGLLWVQGWLLAHSPAGRQEPALATTALLRPLVARPARAATAVLACMAVTASMVAFRGDATVIETRDVALRAEPNAGSWDMWVVASPEEIEVPAPPRRGSDRADSELAEMKRLSIQRDATVRKAVKKWSGAVPTKPWTELAFEYVSKSEKNPPLSSRNYALLNVAMYDAIVTTWNWKYHYNLAPPDGVTRMVPAGSDPSYPSEHAAIAGAASRVLAHLYPSFSALRLDEMADEAALSRVQAGVNTPSDVAAGLELGRQVAERVIAYADADGAGQKWDGNRPPGIGRGPQFWEPPPGTVSPPTEPMAAHWKPWVMRSGDQFRPPPPPEFGSPQFVAAAQEIIDIRNNLTPEQKQIAKFYEGAEGTQLPAGIIVDVAAKDVLKAASEDVAARRMTIPQAARAFALLNVALADAGIATWDAKYAYWNPRPENAIRDLGLDPNWTPLLPTPRFPAYPSGSAGYAGAAEVVLKYLFPEKGAELAKRAEDQAASRLYAGIHWRYDSVSLDMGRRIGDLAVERARHDGS